MTVIHTAKNEGVIDDDTAKRYKETIIRRTDHLLELKVIPKNLVSSEPYNTSQKILSEYSEQKLLGQGEKSS